MAVALGKDFLRALVEAFGLEGRAVRRLVIDVAIDSAVKMYVEEFANADSPALANLASELPKVNPFVQFVDRVSVENAGGTEIRIKHVQHEDDEARSLCHKLIDVLKHGSDEKKSELKAAIYRLGVL